MRSFQSNLAPHFLHLSQGHLIGKCHIPVDISKIKIKTQHFLGIKDKPSGRGVAAELCDKKGFSPEVVAVHGGHVPVSPPLE